MIPAGIAAGDLGRARSSVAPRKGTSCHVGPGGQAVRVRERRRGARADARALAGRPAGRDWAEREAERAQLGFSAGASARVGPGWGEAGPSELGRGELGRCAAGLERPRREGALRGLGWREPVGPGEKREGGSGPRVRLG